MDRPVLIGRGIQSVDGVVLKFFVCSVVSKGPCRSLVIRVGEPNSPLRIDDQIVRNVERFSFKPIDKHRHLPVLFVADDPELPQEGQTSSSSPESSTIAMGFSEFRGELQQWRRCSCSTPRSGASSPVWLVCYDQKSFPSSTTKFAQETKYQSLVVQATGRLRFPLIQENAQKKGRCRNTRSTCLLGGLQIPFSRRCRSDLSIT